ncbi:MAG: DUF2062 domain-containing protein [Rhodospirillales bacterium]|nr:DUF2062 domain-containing protein [Rhodospirillales bacterium]
MTTGSTHRKKRSRRKRGVWNGLARLTRFRLVIPILRSKHPPEYTARGVLVGMAWALTPLVGIQMYLVFMTWLITRKLFNWDFSLIVGLAWTWTTNVFTMLPTYYVFYLTGQVLLGNWNDISGYNSFVETYLRTFEDGLSTWETVQTYAVMIVKDWGVAMAVGSLPWAAIGGWLGYRFGLMYALRRAARLQQKRRHHRHASPTVPHLHSQRAGN